MTGFEPQLIIVHAGFCDTTTKNPCIRKMTLNNITETDVVNKIMVDVQQAHMEINILGELLVSFATITGINNRNNRSSSKRLHLSPEHD